MNPMPKKIIIAVSLFLFLVIVLFFRGEISRLLGFGAEKLPPPFSLPLRPELKEKEVLGVGSENPETVSLPATNQPVQKSTVPFYAGRDPAEIRPVAEEVKLLTEEQKQQLYAALKTNARVVKDNPAFFGGWIQIGVLKKIIGDFEGARDVWEYASLIEPFNSLSFANLGDLYWRYLGDYSKAEENLKTSIKNKPDDVFTYITLAELYHYSIKEKRDQAPQVLLDGLSANPNDAGTLMRRLAYLYEQQNKFSEALEWWQKVLAKSPDDQEVTNKINKLKIKIGGGS